MNARDFRTDINGLRAVAVLGVVLYHFGLAGFSSGYAGVDVFFVISGFLMTGIIVSALDQRRFSVFNFYLSRARRIIPALAALCVFLLAAGYFWLIPSDYKTLGEHAASAITFVSNFVFKGEEGYFDAPMRDKWLLHTWSLSVEWQFYLLYPLLLAALWRGGKPSRQKLVNIFIAVGLLTLACSVTMSSLKPSFAFYLLPARIWEFIAGGLVWLLPLRPNAPARTKKFLEAAGLACIAASFLAFDDDALWPGYLAALPVLGAALVIAASRERSVLTGNLFFQWTGTRSYSIYLWHWPVFVGLHYFGMTSMAAALAGIAASLALGAASFTLVETPVRKISIRGKQAWAAVFATLALIGGAGLGVRELRGMPHRVSAEILNTDRAAENKYTAPKNCGYDRHAKTLKSCPLGTGKPRFALWGDSHAGAVATAVRDASGGGGLLYDFSCPTIFNAHVRGKMRDSCDTFDALVLKDLRALPRKTPVIVVNRFSYYLYGPNEGVRRIRGLDYTDIPETESRKDPEGAFVKKLEDSLCAIAKEHPVYVLMPLPEMGADVPKAMARSLMTGTRVPPIGISLEDYERRHETVLAALDGASGRCGINILDPVPYLCKDGLCPGAENGQPLYFDDDHLNETGNKRLVPLFRTVFR